MFKKIFVSLSCFLFVVGFVNAANDEKVLYNGKKNTEKKYSYLYDTSLIQAIKKQDIERVNFLLLANVNPN